MLLGPLAALSRVANTATPLLVQSGDGFCQSVCLSGVLRVESIEMPFGMVGQMGPRMIFFLAGWRLQRRANFFAGEEDQTAQCNVWGEFGTVKWI